MSQTDNLIEVDATRGIVSDSKSKVALGAFIIHNKRTMERHKSFTPNWLGLIRFMRDPVADWKPKAAIALAVLYLIWPIDLIPDFAPIIGWLDDIGITTLAVAYLLHASSLYSKQIDPSHSREDGNPEKNEIDGSPHTRG